MNDQKIKVSTEFSKICTQDSNSVSKAAASVRNRKGKNRKFRKITERAEGMRV